MKNKERWLLSLKHYDGEGHAYDEGKIIHVIDATGMPTKEEIRKATHYLVQSFGYSSKTINPEVFNLVCWLKSLTSE